MQRRHPGVARTRRALAALAGFTLAAGGTLAAVAAPARAATSITINGASSGRTLDGIGAVSGGGGNSRLLIDYPEPQRSQILDYLFKPGYGAALQVLKVEVGGDTNSTSGAEPSIEHTRGVVNCTAGYEFWMMRQAKARNPNITFVGLAWGAPGWIGNGTFQSTDMIKYLISWLGCAKADGVPVSYLGASQNERQWSVSWTEQLRSALNAAGYSSVKLIIGDNYGEWSGADQVNSDPTFAGTVDVLSAHYPCGYQGPQSTCTVPSNVTATGKTLWAGENGSQDYNVGSQPIARGLNRDYIDGKMTAYLNWDLIAAITPNLPWPTTGLMVADQPWSGNYAVGKSLWAIAQTSQFTARGWQYLDASSGYVGGNRNNGSYVSLKSTNNRDYSTIIETMDAASAQTLNFTVAGGLSTGQVHVWSTNLSSNNSADYMVHAADITPTGGNFSVTVQPGYIYSITTTTGQGKGAATSPASRSLALPDSDNFDAYTAGAEAKYLQTWQGAFEAQPCGAGRSGMCLRQMAARAPIVWKSVGDQDTYGGDLGWSNYTLSSDLLLEQPGYAELIGRAGTQNDNNINGLNAYLLRVSDTGAWSILRDNTSRQFTTLARGTTAALGTGKWHALSLGFSGSAITASIDGAVVGTVTDSIWSAGQVGYGTSVGETAQFDNLSVTPNSGPPPPASGAVHAVGAGKCLDVPGSTTTAGTQTDIWDCNSQANQSWAHTSSGQLTVYSGSAQLCLDANGAGTSPGTKAIVWPCNGGSNQQWNVSSNGAVTSASSGLCLDVTGGATANGALVELWTCNGGSNQQWTLN